MNADCVANCCHDNADVSRERTRRCDAERSGNVTNNDVSVASTQDVNPGFALKKLAILFESSKYDECAVMINKLTGVMVRSILQELPVEVFIDAIPQSLVVLESLYVKVFSVDCLERFPAKQLRPERTVLQMVHWLSSSSSRHQPSSPCPPDSKRDTREKAARNILAIIVQTHPVVLDDLIRRRDALRSCLLELGSHGLAHTSDNKMMQLHDALRIECHKTTQQLKSNVQKLDELNVAHRRAVPTSLMAGPVPTCANHQRLMQVKIWCTQPVLLFGRKKGNI